MASSLTLQRSRNRPPTLREITFGVVVVVVVVAVVAAVAVTAVLVGDNDNAAAARLFFRPLLCFCCFSFDHLGRVIRWCNGWKSAP